jgi:hypothetical protein
VRHRRRSGPSYRPGYCRRGLIKRPAEPPSPLFAAPMEPPGYPVADPSVHRPRGDAKSTPPLKDLAEWLKSLGLGRYVPTFRSNDVDSKVLPELMADNLTGIIAP